MLLLSADFSWFHAAGVLEGSGRPGSVYDGWMQPDGWYRGGRPAAAGGESLLVIYAHIQDQTVWPWVVLQSRVEGLSEPQQGERCWGAAIPTLFPLLILQFKSRFPLMGGSVLLY